jgi:hypothetical protein
MELGQLEQSVKEHEEEYQNLQLSEQIQKEREDHMSHIRSLQRQSNLSRERDMQHSERITSLHGLTKFEETATEAKQQYIIAQEDYKFVKQQGRLIRETATARKKAEKLNELAIAQQEHTEAMRQFQEAQANYEMNKKLYEEREKTEILKRETEKLKYYIDEEKINAFNSETETLAMKQAELEHEKLRPSLIHKANAEVLQSTFEARTSGAKILFEDQLQTMGNEIKTQVANHQELHYQNTRNDLLAKEQKTTLELSHITGTNTGIESNLIFQINAISEQIK